MACAREDPVAGLAPRGRSTSASHHRLEAEAERERMPVPAPDRGERQQSGAAEQICIRLPLASGAFMFALGAVVLSFGATSGAKG